MPDFKIPVPWVWPITIPASSGSGTGSSGTLAATEVAGFNALVGNFYPVDPGAGNINAQLPAATASGAVGSALAVIEIKNISTNVGTVTLVPNGGDTIDNGLAVPYVLDPNQSVRLVSDGVSNWMTAP